MRDYRSGTGQDTIERGRGAMTPSTVPLAMNGKQESPAKGQETSGREKELHTTTSDGGTTETTVEPGEPVWGSLQVPDLVDSSTTISVAGYSYDDQPPQVECTVGLNGLSLSISFPAARAYELAEELTLAAGAAERKD